MNARWVLAFGVLAGLAGSVPAQEVLFQDPNLPVYRGGAGGFVLSPVDAPVVEGSPLFLDAQQAGPAGPPVQLGGTVNGRPLATFGTLPPIFPSNLGVDVGFEFLRPVFPNRSVTLTVPSGVNNNFSALGGAGDLSFDFGFVPRVTMSYQFPDLGFGVSSSGQLTSLNGHLNRTIDSAGGSATLTASSTIDIGVANLLEGTVWIPLDRFECFRDTCWDDGVLLATLGARYSHLGQNYTETLTSGGNGSTLTAHQDWDGFGLTVSLQFMKPLPCDFYFYGVSRGSFLLGTNNRTSTLSVVVPANPSANALTQLTDNRTDFVPVGEFEVGLAWGRPLARRPGPALADAADPRPATGAIFWVKAGVVADVWGSLGFLSAPNGAEGFSDSALFLYGFSVMAGFKF